MDKPASLKQKDHPKVRKGARRDMDAKLDEMIQWMQEIGTILQEFIRMNGLRTPSYPPNLFRLTLTHQDEGANLEEEGVAQEYPRTEDEYEVTFQPQFSTPKGPVIRSPTYQAPSMSGSSHRTYVKGKGKAPMEQKHSHPLVDPEED
ncbi:hypothetical protein PVK06_025073 [Gossypium arboreum]|uniref:Uncharacterized protein n=1 Tax=Gossypium arboreum TaxID=29729 RepID=A0ABR0PFL6_GOSAR|nr:hypothetical protein PVK06_025073 [Gossypium arboreum]